MQITGKIIKKIIPLQLTILMLVFLTDPVVAQIADSSSVAPDTSGIVLVMESIDSTQTGFPDSLQSEDIHLQDSPENRGFLIVASNGKAQLRLRGSIRVNGVYDLNGLQTRNTFSTYDIPVGEGNIAEPRFFMNSSQSRIGIEAARETGIGEVFMRIEGDFLDSDRFRLRHAFGATDLFLIGQTWSTFGDVGSIPLTVDLDGPNSAVAERTIQIRYKSHHANNLQWSVAIESPKPEITLPDTFSFLIESTFQSFPDISARIRKTGEWGHFQLAGIIRSITAKNIEEELEYLVGFGMLLSGKIKLDSHSELRFQSFFGEAISRYVTALVGNGLDAIFNPNSLKLETVTSMGGFLSFGRHWEPDISTYFTVGLTNVLNKDFQPDNAFNNSQYLSANLFWDVTAGTRLGLEYAFGRRVNKNNDNGTANRFSFIVYYDF